MAIVKPVFLRPVEITTANNDFSVKLYLTVGGYTQYDISLDTGVWGSVFNLAAGIAAEVDALSLQYSCTASFVVSGDDLKIKFTVTDVDNNGFAALWDWDEVYDIIGSAGFGSFAHDTDTYDTNSSDEYYYTMTYRPSHMWIPKYQNANQARFYLDQKEIFSGNMAKSGFLHGNRSGPNIYWKDVEFVNESAENVFKEACTSNRMDVRTLEEFGEKCRTIGVEVAGNPCAKGFYFVPDWTDLQTTCSELHTDNGGINFDYSSSPDTYVFCNLTPNGYAQPVASLPTGRQYYSVGFTMHTQDTTVSWQYYVAPA